MSKERFYIITYQYKYEPFNPNSKYKLANEITSRSPTEWLKNMWDNSNPTFQEFVLMGSIEISKEEFIELTSCSDDEDEDE